MYSRSRTRAAQFSQPSRCSSWLTLTPDSNIPRSSLISHLACRECCSCNRLLFPLSGAEKIAKLHTRFVQLRFAVADRAAKHVGNLIVFIAFHVMQHENESVAG